MLYFFIVEINVESVNFIQMSKKMQKYYYDDDDGRQLGF